MSPSVEPFDEVKYKALMDGLEISEVSFVNINLGDRYDAEYFTKEYLNIEERLKGVNTKYIGELATSVASAFYPAATHLYASGDTAFARCVDCINYPIITCDQYDHFEKIPYNFAEENKGISILKKGDIIITKVGTPCYASIIVCSSPVALSRTVCGLSKIDGVDPHYLMIFLRCKYGFEQLFRQRELTIQYQLTLSRINAIKVFIPSREFQIAIRDVCSKYLTSLIESRNLYADAENLVSKMVMLPTFSTKSTSVKLMSNSFTRSGRLDAEYYHPKYDDLFNSLQNLNCRHLGGEKGLVDIKKSIEPGSEAYQSDGIPFIRVSDISKYEMSSPEIHLSHDVVKNIESLYPKKDTILLSKDGSVGIAYKLERDEKVVTSGALLHLTVKNPDEILPDYLTLVLNSPIVQMQAERDSSGAIIQHWKPSEIENVLIPILDMGIQKEIVDMVQGAFTLRRQSKQLLEYAKQAVEMAIEQGEDIALSWLKDKISGSEI